MSNIEDHIRRAMEEGKFDDLPGKGKPLQLDDDALVDPEWRLAHHILRSSGFTLPWIERRQEIERLIEEARTALKRSQSWHQEALADSGRDAAFIQAEWQKAVDLFKRQVVEINQQIRTFNLEAPSERFHLRPIDVQHDLNT